MSTEIGDASAAIAFTRRRLYGGTVHTGPGDEALAAEPFTMGGFETKAAEPLTRL